MHGRQQHDPTSDREATAAAGANLDRAPVSTLLHPRVRTAPGDAHPPPPPQQSPALPSVAAGEAPLAAAAQPAGPTQLQAAHQVLPALPGSWLLKLPGPGAEAHFSRWYVNVNFVQDLLVLVVELLLVSSFINLRLVQQLACGAPGAADPVTDTTLVAAGGYSRHSDIALGQAADCHSRLNVQTIPYTAVRAMPAVQQDFQARLVGCLAAPDTWPLFRWLLQQLQAALQAFPCDDRAALPHMAAADISPAKGGSTSSTRGPQGRQAPAGACGGSNGKAHKGIGGADGGTGASTSGGRRDAAARATGAWSLWGSQLTWVLMHLYQVWYITQVYALDWSFILWSAGLHINLLARLLGMRAYCRYPWLRTLLIVVTRAGMMLGHLVTLHLLRLGRLPALQLTTTVYFTATRQRLGLMYVVWKAAGIAKVPCKHQLWLGIVECVAAIAVMAQADMATHGHILFRRCGVGAAWLLVYAVPLVLVLRSEGQARVQLLMQQQQQQQRQR